MFYVIFEDGVVSRLKTKSGAEEEQSYYSQVPSIVVSKDNFKKIKEES
jgi:hypothetical protein